MNYKRVPLIWVLLVSLVMICFGVFMLITVPETGTPEGTQQLELE